MQNVNFDKEMEKVVSNLEKKKKLLLHACCAPCSTACIERLSSAFDITIYFYNPNMDTKEEYYKRLNEQIRLCQSLGIETLYESYDTQEFYDAVRGLEKEPEGGKRCEKCFYLRLKKTALKAKELGFDYFTTTLTVSPLKNSYLINTIGQTVESECHINFLPSDFKKKNGYKRSVELSAEYGLYRQNYCGCVFSKVNR